ncbi:MAG TPA: flagellar basal body P-ring formation chaperone FlgA [Candidatus Binatia bacterium]
MRSREAKSAAIIGALMGLLLSLTASADEKAGQVVSQQQVEETLHRYILTTGVWDAQQIEVRALSYKPVPVRHGKIALRVAKPAKGITPGVQTVLLAADVDGKEESQIWVRTEIKVHDNVVVSARPLARRQVIGSEDVRLDWREISSSNPRPLTKIEDAIGKQVARATNANEVLTSSLAEPPQVVRHGGPVLLIYETERLRVEAVGEALQAGKVGDVIRVKNPASGKLLQGVVIDGRTVKVSQ